MYVYFGVPWGHNLCLWMTRYKHRKRMPSIGGYHRYGVPRILTGLESNRACAGYAWPTSCSPSTAFYMSTGTSKSIA
ncbi:nibrin [Trichonephila clavipes]|nr:nibrin [Trichonephila clavipes]